MFKSKKNAVWIAAMGFVLVGISPVAAEAPCPAPTASTPSTKAKKKNKYPSVLTFPYQANSNGCDIVSWIGTLGRTKEYKSPAVLGIIEVRASSVTSDSAPPGALLARQLLRFTTKPEKQSWVSFDFGKHVIRPSHYTLRHYASWDVEALRNWVFEGSVNGKTWTLLRQHTKDQALSGKSDTHTWALSGPNAQKAYRYFRVRQTGLNSNGHYYLALSGFEIYGLLE